MKITMIQFPTCESIEENLKTLASCSKQIQETDVIVLPELWATPFDHQAIHRSLPYEDELIQALFALAEEKHAYVIGGTIAHQQDQTIYNTCFCFEDSGKEIGSYSKMHLLEVHALSSFYEADTFTPGHSFFTFKIGPIKAGVVICYDIRFPELVRILSQEGIQILFVPAAFNQKVGELHWEALLKTRAIENEIFVVGVDPLYSYKRYQAYGHSMIVDPFGRVLYCMNDHEMVKTIEIDLERIEKTRKRMPLWKQRRSDLYECKKKND